MPPPATPCIAHCGRNITRGKVCPHCWPRLPARIRRKLAACDANEHLRNTDQHHRALADAHDWFHANDPDRRAPRTCPNPACGIELNISRKVADQAPDQLYATMCAACRSVFVSDDGPTGETMRLPTADELAEIHTRPAYQALMAQLDAHPDDPTAAARAAARSLAPTAPSRR